MTFTISLGWWLIPAFITFVALGGSIVWANKIENGPYGIGAIIGCGGIMIGLIVSLAAWLLWAVL